MNCSIIYYSARKTSFCEKVLKKAFSELELNLSSAVFATKREELGEELTKAFKGADTVFTVGGLEFDDSRSARDLVSSAAKDNAPDLCRRLKNNAGDDGYLLRAGKQLLIMLPDEPEQIEEIMRGPVAAYIKSI